MPHQRLLELLEALPKRQRKRLSLFVASPYHNDGYNAEALQELLQLLLDENLDEHAPLLAKEALQIRFYPDKPFVPKSKNTIDLLTSDLFKLVVRFLVQEEQADELQRREPLILARFYKRSGMKERFWQAVNTYRKNWEKQAPYDEHDYYERFLLEEEAAAFISYYNPQAEDDNVAQLNEYLDKSFVTRKLELGFTLLYKQVKRPDLSLPDDPLLQQLLKSYEDQEAYRSKVGDLFFLANQVLQQPEDETLLARFYESLSTSESEIPALQYRNLLAIYRYFIGRHYRLQGEPGIRRRLFELLQEHFSGGYLEVEGKLLPNTFRMLINLAIWEKEFEWAHSVLDRYPPEQILGTRYPTEFHNLSRADLLFAEGKRAEAEELITYRQFQDTHYSIMSDVLLVKIYYETENELFESRLRALELKIRRAKGIPIDQKAYLNFISTLKRIHKYQWTNDTKKLGRIRDKIKDGLVLINREWLLGILKG